MDISTFKAYKVIRLDSGNYGICEMLISNNHLFVNDRGFRVAKRVFVTDIVDKTGKHVADSGYSYWADYNKPKDKKFFYRVNEYTDDNTGHGIYFLKTKREVRKYLNEKRGYFT